MSNRVWMAALLMLAAAGCSTAPTQHQTSTQPMAMISGDRSVQSGPMSFEQLAQKLPARLSNAEADKMLVSLPADELKGPLAGPRHTQQWLGGYRFYGLGNYYYPYYSYGANWYPYSYYSLGNWYYPYYYGTYGSYWPYSYRYRRFWW